MTAQRLLSALAAAAAIAVLVIGIAASLLIDIPDFGFLAAVAVIACVITFVVGVPAFLITRAWNLKSRSGYAAVGGVVSLLPAALLESAYPEMKLTVATVIAGLCGGFVFGLIATWPLTTAGADALGSSGEPRRQRNDDQVQ